MPAFNFFDAYLIFFDASPRMNTRIQKLSKEGVARELRRIRINLQGTIAAEGWKLLLWSVGTTVGLVVLGV